MVILISIISAFIFSISYYSFGLSFILIKALALDIILIIVSIIDIKYRIIPDTIIVITFIIGFILFFISDEPFVEFIFSMFLGGGILFVLALIPGAIGGGDIKLMFTLGTFLSLTEVLETLLIAFISAAVLSIFLVFLKYKRIKDFIPFGPFLALGCFITFHFFT